MKLVSPVPPFVVAKVPVTPVESGNPVAFVSVSTEGVPKFGVVSVGDVANTLLPDPVFVTLATFLLASSASAVDAVSPERVSAPVTLALVTVVLVIVTLPLLTVTFANVMLFSVVTVLPSWIAVLPSVIAVPKLLSSWDSGIAVVAVANVYGTGMLEPHS